MESDRNGTTWRSREPVQRSLRTARSGPTLSDVPAPYGLRCSHGGRLFTIFLNIAPEICIAAAPQGLKSVLPSPDVKAIAAVLLCARRLRLLP